MQEKRCVITGMGIISPIGDTLDEFYANLIAGKSGIRRLTSIDTSLIKAKIGGDIGDYDCKGKIRSYRERIPEEVFLRMRKISKTAPFGTQLAMIAAMDTYIDAGLIDYPFDKHRMGVILGGHNLHDQYLLKNVRQFFEEPEYIDGLMGIVAFDTDVPASICEPLGLTGPMYIMGGTCASAGIALRNALWEIRYGDCERVLVGGGITDFSELGFHALSKIKAISDLSFNDQPEKASRPYDRRREGFVPSHGCGMFVLEDLEKARDRGAKIYAEVLAAETCNDANHLSNPSFEGQVRTISRALEKAGIAPQQIDYVNAHATSTPLGDIVEIKSIKEVFGHHAPRLKINATKSILGHTGWTAHSVELIASILQMNQATLHPSINIEELDPEVDLDVCANRCQPYEINCFLNNSFGFGGLNCCSVIHRFSE